MSEICVNICTHTKDSNTYLSASRKTQLMLGWQQPTRQHWLVDCATMIWFESLSRSIVMVPGAVAILIESGRRVIDAVKIRLGDFYEHK